MKEATDQSGPFRRILIASSDAEASALLRQLVESPDRSVDVRAGLADVLEYLQQQPVDLVVIHLDGEATGTRLSLQILQRHPHTRLMLMSCPPPPDALGRTAAAPPGARQRPARYGAPCQLADSVPAP